MKRARGYAVTRLPGARGESAPLARAMSSMRVWGVAKRPRLLYTRIPAMLTMTPEHNASPPELTYLSPPSLARRRVWGPTRTTTRAAVTASAHHAHDIWCAVHHARDVPRAPYVGFSSTADPGSAGARASQLRRSQLWQNIWSDSQISARLVMLLWWSVIRNWDIRGKTWCGCRQDFNDACKASRGSRCAASAGVNAGG
jgi:hypothetical protein